MVRPRRGPGSAPSGIWLVGLDIGPDQGRGRVRTEAHTAGPRQRVGTLAYSRSRSKGCGWPAQEHPSPVCTPPPAPPRTIPPPHGQHNRGTSINIPPWAGVTHKLRGDNGARQRTAAPSLLHLSRAVCHLRGPGAGCLAENSQSHQLAAGSKAEQNSDSFSYGAYF